MSERGSSHCRTALDTESAWIHTANEASLWP